MQILEIYNDRVLIKLIPQEKTSGGIIIPDTVTSLPKSKATVIKTGKGFTDERTGEFFPNTVKEGDTVILSTFVCHSDNEFIIEGEKYYLLRERDLDCKLIEEDEISTAVKNVKKISRGHWELDLSKVNL